MPDLRDESSVTPTAAWEAPSLAKPYVPPRDPVIRGYTTLATAAFSRRDSRLPGYPAAVEFDIRDELERTILDILRIDVLPASELEQPSG